ncbi:MAG: succinate dehydrogenase, hydrophobic membrane anchor protein [Gammaproteobacteria bacterium]|nr:succinate dehydrogenase, hydrophobic membrane anchor protein [Gammaproteobacteria bacterium]
MSWRAHGMRAWLLQRLSALYMLLFAISFLLYIAPNLPITYEYWSDLFTRPSIAVATLVFFAALLYHAWIGIRDIIVDYIHDTTLRFTLWVLVTLFLIGLGIWVALIVLSVVAV